MHRPFFPLVAAASILFFTPVPVVAQTAAVAMKPDSAQAQAEFVAASREMKELVAELQVLQADYQKPDADKKAVEARFEATKKKAQATSERLEAAAFGLVVLDPKNEPAREITGAVVAAALQNDDPRKALELANQLGKAGAASSDVMMMAATASMLVSDLDAAADWLKQAQAAGIPTPKIAELQQAIVAERPKV